MTEKQIREFEDEIKIKSEIMPENTKHKFECSCETCVFWSSGWNRGWEEAVKYYKINNLT